MRILISGAGIAGPTLAYWLRNDRTMFLFTFADADPQLPTDLSGQKALLRQRFAHSGWECPQILDALEVSPDLYRMDCKPHGWPRVQRSNCTAGLLTHHRSLEARMKASLFYRIAAVLLLLFAVGHTLGFRQSDPTWGVDAVLASLQSIHFDVQGFNRSYWDFFVAAGFSVGVFYLFAAILAWQLGGLPVAMLALMRGTAWAFALSFAAITVVSWRYLFIVPVAFSIAITVCLTAGAWLSAKQVRS